MAKRPHPPSGDHHRGDLLWTLDRLCVVPEFTFTVPHKPANLNDIIRMKGNPNQHHLWSGYKREWERCIRHHWVTAAHSKGNKPPRVPGPYTCRFLYLCKDRRSDPSNIHAAVEKVVLDALVDGRALDGDGFKLHQGTSYEATHADKWGIVITIMATGESNARQ